MMPTKWWSGPAPPWQRDGGRRQRKSGDGALRKPAARTDAVVLQKKAPLPFAVLAHPLCSTSQMSQKALLGYGFRRIREAAMRCGLALLMLLLAVLATWLPAAAQADNAVPW